MSGPLDECRDTFRKWLGTEYDLGALDAVLAVAATEQIDGDPVWLLIVSGSGNAKTETVSALAGAGAYVTSTITSEGALLSATSSKEKAKNANGGLLRKIGDHGLLVIKDFTSIISMNKDARAAVLAALREVYDGRWERNVGTDGGRTLTWDGRVTLVGAVTTAYDTAHLVIAAMGDRFALVRVDSNIGRLPAGRRALDNVGDEVPMRAELSAAVRDLLASADASRSRAVGGDDDELLLGLADLVTLTRTGVEHDYRGDPTDAHMPEMPTRFAKMLKQVMRGALAIGADHDDALSAAVRVAGDSMPPGRMQLLADLVEHPGSTTAAVRDRVQRPYSTIDRSLQDLQLIGLVEHRESGEGSKRWLWSIAPKVVQADLSILVGRKFTRNVWTGALGDREEQDQPDGDHGHVSQGPYIPGESLDPRATTDPAGPDIGPCVRCGEGCRRYGPDADPLCSRCRGAA